jgi:Spy/CpxP family protein refolding chaperone
VALLLALLIATPVAAQKPPRQPGPPQSPAFEKHLFAPDLVMRHQQEIGLRAEQRQALIAELQQTQADLVPLQFEISEAGERLVQLFEAPRVDEQEALAAAERVMELESRIKTRHMSLVIRIKNLLTEEQQAELRRLRDRS